MEKRTVPRSTIGTYWVWEMPEIASEIPTLLAEAGQARVVSQNIMGVEVVIQLKQPAKVVDWRQHGGDGVAINSDTYACITGGKPSIRVHRLPKAGDEMISLSIDLSLDTFKETDTVTLDDLRKALTDFATRMTRTWYYHFK